VASLLAANDNDRSAVLRLMKSFYDTRSKLVHGGRLKEKHQSLLQRVEELRSIARRLLKSFVEFAVTPPGQYGKEFWDDLDAALVNSAQREGLRTALGLNLET